MNESNSNLEKVKSALECINEDISYLIHSEKEMVSDGFHTFKELYDFRMVYNAALFNEWAVQKIKTGNYLLSNPPQIEYKIKYNVHKSWKHYNGEWCFGKEKEWFIVVAMLPTGQISNHYEEKYWDLFKVPEAEKALFEWDGHSSQDVLERLKSL